MKTQLVIIGLLFTGLVACHSQVPKKDLSKKDKKNPNEEIVVNKKYDENGNLVAMDSVYTYYYSNIEGDTLMTDSLLSDFDTYFGENFSGFSQDHFFDMDSDYMHGFFHGNYFEKSFLDQEGHLLRMMQQMDSIKNEFFKLYSQKNE